MEWSDDSESVWVGERGRLHLRLRQVGGTWQGAEVCTEAPGHGTYTFQVATNVESYAPDVVAGLFLYREGPTEIDIEFSRWGTRDSSRTGHYTVWNGKRTPVGQTSFRMGSQERGSTHQFTWAPTYVEARSWRGPKERPTTQTQIQEWTYSGDEVPTEGDDRLCINLWLYRGADPGSDRTAELVVSDVSVDPL